MSDLIIKAEKMSLHAVHREKSLSDGSEQKIQSERLQEFKLARKRWHAWIIHPLCKLCLKGRDYVSFVRRTIVHLEHVFELCDFNHSADVKNLMDNMLSVNENVFFNIATERSTHNFDMFSTLLKKIMEKSILFPENQSMRNVVVSMINMGIYYPQVFQQLGLLDGKASIKTGKAKAHHKLQDLAKRPKTHALIMQSASFSRLAESSKSFLIQEALTSLQQLSEETFFNLAATETRPRFAKACISLLLTLMRNALLAVPICNNLPQSALHLMEVLKLCQQIESLYCPGLPDDHLKNIKSQCQAIAGAVDNKLKAMGVVIRMPKKEEKK